MPLDFTYNKYKQIAEAVANSDYPVLTIEDYILMEKKPERFIILRHDVDLNAEYQLRFARMENELGLKSSYYFRHIEGVFNPSVIDQIAGLGHEVGYHYEVFTKANGDAKKAAEIFEKEQEAFSRQWMSKTVCPHGGSFVTSKNGYSLKSIFFLLPKLLTKEKIFADQVNFNFWDNNSFKDFNIIGDAYESVNFGDILYLSDTGRSWKQKYKRLDKVDSKVNKQFNIRSSNDIIEIIREGKANKLYLLVHFEQWKSNFPDWVAWYLAQVVRRTGKRIIFGK